MDDADLFQEAMSSFGGRVDLTIDPLAHMYQLHIDQTRKTIARADAAIPSLPPIYFDLVDNSELQAWAFTYEGRYFIALHMGAIDALCALFYRMLADPEVLPHVGDPTKENPNLPILPALGPDAQPLIDAGVVITEPRDETRRDYAINLWITAVRFLGVHEVCHISEGHVDYFAQVLRAGFMPEFGFRPRSTDEARDLQTMELFADNRAVKSGFEAIRQNLDAAKEKNPPRGWHQFYRDPIQSAYDWAFSINSFMRLFGDDRLTAINLAATQLVSALGRLVRLTCPTERSCTPGFLLSCLHGRTRLFRLPGVATPRRRTGSPGRATYPPARTAAARRQASGSPFC